MKPRHEEASAFAALADPTRRAILKMLRSGSRTAGAIADEFHLLKRKYDTIANEMNQRTNSLANALDEVLQDSRRAG